MESASVAAWAAVVTFLLGGCCANVFYLEMLFRHIPSSSHLVTLAQFLLASLLGLPNVLSVSCGRIRVRPSPLPLGRLLVTVLLFFLTTAANNLALGYSVPMPVHIIFRSGSLIASSLLNVLILNKSYPTTCYAAIAMITAGVAATTFATQQDKSDTQHPRDMGQFLVGIALLSIALLAACFLGMYQEETYRRHGAHWKQALFYSHFLALPLFLLVLPQILDDARLFTDSQLIGGHVPEGWLYLFFNTVTQYICVAAVHKLTSITTSLTTILVLTLRKFLSLVISMLWFGDTVVQGHVVGGALVFAGTTLYILTSNKKNNNSMKRKHKKSKLPSPQKQEIK